MDKKQCYNILQNGEHLLEGYVIIGDVLDFSTSSEIYDNIGINYSIELIEDVLADRFPLYLQVFVFDCLIGNTDRHHGNWAFITDDNGVWLRFAPLYDNGASLCYLERVERIELMQKDARMLEAALYTKPKSQIGLGSTRPVKMEILYLTKTDREGNKVLIGELAKNNGEYIFRYTLGETDRPEGFIRVPTFRDIGRVYKSNNLFLFFANRLFDRGRPDLPKILERYGLAEYNEWELLKATKARLMTDGYELSPNFGNAV